MGTQGPTNTSMAALPPWVTGDLQKINIVERLQWASKQMKRMKPAWPSGPSFRTVSLTVGCAVCPPPSPSISESSLSVGTNLLKGSISYLTSWASAEKPTHRRALGNDGLRTRNRAPAFPDEDRSRRSLRTQACLDGLMGPSVLLAVFQLQSPFSPLFKEKKFSLDTLKAHFKLP